MSLYEVLSASPEGRRGLASARLRYDVISALHAALSASGMTQAGLAAALGIRRSAVNAVFRGTGNLRVNTIAEYLHELGMEGCFVARPSGAAREESRVWQRVVVSTTFPQAADGDPGEWVPQMRGSSIRVTHASSTRSDFSTAA